MDKNALSRRTFLQLFAAVSTSGFLAGCGGGSASSDSGTAADAAAGEDFTITFAQGADPRGLDPAYADDGESAQVWTQIYENLLQYADDSCEVVPGLADLPEVSDDGLTYTFKVKEGITFHDGTPFNADAARQSIARQLEPDRTEDMAYAGFTFGSEAEGNGIESIEAPDDTTLVIHMRAASTPFLANLAMCMASPIVAPTAFETAIETPVGTGPYKFVSWTKGDNIVLERNEDYWNPENAGKAKQIVFRFIAEAAPRVTALTNGEVDIINGIDEAVVGTVTDGGCVIDARDGMNINYMAFRTDQGVCADPAVRIALSKAINVPELVESLYGEYGTYANSIMPLWMAPYDEDVVQTQYDPEAAATELADLGVKSVKCITYSNPRPYNGKGGQVLAEAIQGYLTKAGVEMTIDTYDWTTYRTKIETETFDICFYGWSGDNGDPDNFMNLLSDANVSMNVARYDNPEYKKLISDGLQTPTGADRDEIYHQLEQINAAEQVWLPISHSQQLVGVRPEVTGYNLHPSSIVFLRGTTKA